MKKIEKLAFAMLAATVLFSLSSCQKSDPDFNFILSTYIIQNKADIDNDIYDFYFGMIGYNEYIQDGTVSITHNNTPISIVSNIPGTAERVPSPSDDIRSFNGAYSFSATSINSKTASITATFTFQDVPLNKFAVEDFRYENGYIHARFKNIDAEASICGFYINPIIDNVPAESKIYATILRNEISPGETDRTVSIAFQEHPDYRGLRIYPMICRANGSILHMLLGDMLEDEVAEN